MLYVLQNSNCHTLDRNNIKAQRDLCGIGVADEEWRFAVDLQFNITHWPYLQNFTTFHCVQKFFTDSYTNMILDKATLNYVLNTLALVASMIVLAWR